VVRCSGNGVYVSVLVLPLRRHRKIDCIFVEYSELLTRIFTQKG